MMQPAEIPPILSVDQLRRYLRIGRARAYRMVARGEIPAIRIGRIWRVPRASLERWVAEHAERHTVIRRGR